MVFGSTYCGISHLEIKDGDTCILIPLGFRMSHEFDRWNKADVSCFTYLHTFIGEAIEVVFEGNVSQIKYARDEKRGSIRRHKKGDTYEEHELFMLVHFKFYNEILSGFSNEIILHLEHIPIFNTVYPIWEKGKEIEDIERRGKIIKKSRNEITDAEAEEKIPTPEWMVNIYKVALFMGNMGIPPHPIFCNDQRQSGKMYETMRKNAQKK